MSVSQHNKVYPKRTSTFSVQFSDDGTTTQNDVSPEMSPEHRPPDNADYMTSMSVRSVPHVTIPSEVDDIVETRPAETPQQWSEGEKKKVSTDKFFSVVQSQKPDISAGVSGAMHVSGNHGDDSEDELDSEWSEEYKDDKMDMVVSYWKQITEESGSVRKTPSRKEIRDYVDQVLTVGIHY